MNNEKIKKLRKMNPFELQREVMDNFNEFITMNARWDIETGVFYIVVQVVDDNFKIQIIHSKMMTFVDKMDRLSLIQEGVMH